MAGVPEAHLVEMARLTSLNKSRLSEAPSRPSLELEGLGQRGSAESGSVAATGGRRNAAALPRSWRMAFSGAEDFGYALAVPGSSVVPISARGWVEFQALHQETTTAPEKTAEVTDEGKGRRKGKPKGKPRASPKAFFFLSSGASLLHQ